MSSLGRGRGRGRPPPAATPTEEEETEIPPATAESMVPSGRVPESPGMQELAERYAEDDQSTEELAARLATSGILLEKSDSPPLAESSNRGRFRGRGATKVTSTPTVEVGLGHGLSIPSDAGSEPKSGSQTSIPRSAEAIGDTPRSGAPTSVSQRLQAVDVHEQQQAAPNQQGGSWNASSVPTPPSAKKVVKSVEPELPVVSRIGSKGTKINVATNYFRLKLAEGRPGVVEYHVSFSTPIESAGLRRRALRQEAFEKKLGKVRSFDGIVLFLPYILNEDVTVLHGVHPADPTTELTVHVTFVKVKAMRDALVFFNILLHRMMLELNYVELRREFYDLNMAQVLKQHKLVIWPGLNLTAEDQEDGLMVNIDSCSRVLREDTVYEYYVLVRGDPKGKQKFYDFVINKIVMTKYNKNSTYRIDDVSWDLNPGCEFDHKGGKISFAAYLKKQYSIEVKDMNQPMLISKLKPRKHEIARGMNQERMAALVPEFCYLTGLTDDQRANFKVMTDLAASTRLDPMQRVQGLRKFMDRVMASERAKELLSEWNLTLEPNIIHLEGRKMEGPTLVFNDRTTIAKAGPNFSREAGIAVYQPIGVTKYVVICTQRDADKARRFIDVYKQVTGPLGIKMLQLGEIIPLRSYQPQDFVKALQQCRQDEFVVLLMPMQRDDVYGAIKKFCVAQFPIPSQCILSKTLGNEKRLRSIVLKIALQINCKLGGSLWALKMPLKEQIMFVGIDAAHDPLKKDPSTVCLVATLNNECTKYYSRAASSKVHQEMADNLKIMMDDALKKFKEFRGIAPDRIVIFRDGGSVGALDNIEKTEMNQLIKAQMEYAANAKFTFAIVAKRIPQRFFLTDARKYKYENPQPGSVIDNTVTRRHIFDFYMVSQQVRHGTVNPTDFVVLNPEDEIQTDLIQKLAYVTSFMYYNWSGTVRVPAMVQYAHKLADLISRHVKAPPHVKVCDTLYYL